MKDSKPVIIYHSPLPENAPADELDVLDQVAFFRAGLQNLGFWVVDLPFPADVSKLEEQLLRIKPEFVVNLVETLFGSGRLVHVAPSLFEHFGIPYTGCRASAIFQTSDKILAKKLMLFAGIQTPDFFSLDQPPAPAQIESASLIVKSVMEHASFGLCESKPLLFSSLQEILDRVANEKNPWHFFAEKYIHGREFNLSLIGDSQNPEVLPPAEIRFNYPPLKPRIVGYKAKWDESSFEYKNTNRSFDFNADDQHLLAQLKDIAVKCWKTFGLNGYARVDFRVDESDQIYVLEINANPCIAANSGFVAAAAKAGYTGTDIVRKIASDCT
jgi:D-alanine-D-alanine ligase